MSVHPIMHPGVTGASEALGGSVWRIFDMTCTPKIVSESAMMWHATIPPGAGTPPHIHPMQDEWLLVLDGVVDVELSGKRHRAVAGETVAMPMSLAHAVSNRSDAAASCLSGVSPTRRLFELFNAIHDVTDLEEIARISARHEVETLP